MTDPGPCLHRICWRVWCSGRGHGSGRTARRTLDDPKGVEKGARHGMVTRGSTRRDEERLITLESRRHTGDASAQSVDKLRQHALRRCSGSIEENIMPILCGPSESTGDS